MLIYKILVLVYFLFVRLIFIGLGILFLFLFVYIYLKFLEPITTQLDPIELPVLPAPACTVWADPTTGLQMEYVRDTNIVIAAFEAALADLATS
jgi:hypothetical protein